MAGKGDTYRPVNLTVYESNYERIWAKSTHEQRDAEASGNGATSYALKATRPDEDSSSLEAPTRQT